MKLTKLAVLAAATVALAAPALAQGAPQTPEQRAARFDAGDADKNGKLTKAEFTASLPEQAKGMADQIWARFDPNGKGEVTKEEYLAVQPMQRPQ
jgi:hypothetical protein